MKNKVLILLIIIAIALGIVSAFVAFYITKGYNYNEICHEKIYGSLMPYDANCAFVHGGWPIEHDLSKTMNDDTRRINGVVPESPALNASDYKDMLQAEKFYLNFLIWSFGWTGAILLLNRLHANSRD